jgi:NarL family two-component system response regulator LiaR
MEVVGEASSGERAVALARSEEPDVILMDLVMPGMGGIEAIGEIMRSDPEAVVLVLSSFADDDKVLPAIRAGARGYLLKEVPPEQLLKAIRDVHAGRPSLHAAITEKLMHELAGSGGASIPETPLTEREIAVLKLVAKGYSNQEIARELNISERTAGTHVSNILDKLHLANRTQAALYALRQGLASLHPK